MLVSNGTSLVTCHSRRRYGPTLLDMVLDLLPGLMSPTIPGEGILKAVKS
jgi:hypothetical protein